MWSALRRCLVLATPVLFLVFTRIRAMMTEEEMNHGRSMRRRPHFSPELGSTCGSTSAGTPSTNTAVMHQHEEDPWVRMLLKAFNCDCLYCKDLGNPAQRRPDQWNVLKNLLDLAKATSTGFRRRGSSLVDDDGVLRDLAGDDAFILAPGGFPASVKKLLQSSIRSVKCAWTRTKDVLHDIANNNTGTTLGRIEDATGVSTEFDNLLNTINGSNYSSLETPGSLFPGDASMSTAAGCDSWQPSSEPSTMIYNPVEIRGPCEKPPQLRLLTTSVEQLENPFRDSLEKSKAATEPKGQIHASRPSAETPSAIIELPIMSFKNPIPQTLPEIGTTDNRVVSKIPDVKNMVLDVHLPFAPKISDFLSFPGNKQQKPVSVKLLFQADDANTSNGFAMLSYLFANKERHHWEPELKLFAVPGDNQIVLDFAIPDADFAGLTLQEVVVDNCCDKRIKTQLSSGDTKLEEEESTSESTKGSSKILVNTMKFKSPSESGNESLDHDKIKDTTISQSGILKLSRSSQSSDDQQQQLNSVESITSRNKSLKRVAFRDRVRFGSIKSNLPINSKKYTNHSVDNEITGDNRWKRTIRPVSELVDHEASRRRSRLMRNYFNGGPFPVDVATSEVTDDGIQMSTSSRNRYLRTSRGFERILKRSRAKTEFNIDCIKKTDSSLQR